MPRRRVPPAIRMSLRRLCSVCGCAAGGSLLPEVALPPGLVSLHAGQELEFHAEIIAGQTYTITARVADVYEKTGRSGPMHIIVRESTITDMEGQTIVTIHERQIVRSPEKKI